MEEARQLGRALFNLFMAVFLLGFDFGRVSHLLACAASRALLQLDSIFKLCLVARGGLLATN